MNGSYLDLGSVGAWNDELLVLMYHYVATPPLFQPLRALYVRPELLRAQWQELQDRDVHFVSLSDGLDLPSRRVTVTFDDGSRTLVTHALPVIAEFRVPAITYVVADRIGRTNDWDENKGAAVVPLMDRADLAEWISAGGEIGSHTLNHCDLTALGEDEAREEIVASKKKLEDLLGRPITHFCYPYGRWTYPLRDMVQEAGYLTAVTTLPGLNPGGSLDPFSLKRFLARHQHPWRLALLGAFPQRTVKTTRHDLQPRS
jgi:peptidoglycan/xylan/chitin deacetylase (PgdA/CDA1 family)